MDTMKAWVLRGKRQMEIEERPMPVPKDNEALVKIQTMGICGSDLHYYKDGKIGSYVVDGPLILGHECAGEIVQVGKDVTRVAPGDRVVLEPGIACGVCGYCKSGKYNLCQEMKFMATPPFDGCLCEYVAWPQDLIFKMPPQMSYDEGALVEPFVVALQGLRQSGFTFSSSAVVVGSGTIGMLMMQALKAVGAGTIIAVDISPAKLEMARAMGATHTVNPLEEDVVARVREFTDGLGAMYGFEACGTDKTYAQMEQLVRDGGTVTLLGLLPEDGTPMPMASSVFRELKYHAVIRYTNVFAEALTMLEYGRAEIMPVLSHRFPFAEAKSAFEEALGNKNAVKVMVDFRL